MRKLLPVILILILVGVVVTLSISDRDERSLPKRFEEGMNFAEYNTYVDPDFGYSLCLPTFFRREDQPTFGAGHVRFGYHVASANMVIECRVLPRSFRSKVDHDFVESEPLSGVRGYHCLTHGVWYHGCWYVISLSYPDEYRQAVNRLLYLVKTWDPRPDWLIKKR